MKGSIRKFDQLFRADGKSIVNKQKKKLSKCAFCKQKNFLYLMKP